MIHTIGPDTPFAILLEAGVRPMLAHSEVLSLFLAMAVLLGAARIAGEICTKFRQPSVLGEIAAGILLGPTVLGHFAPGVSEFLFPTTDGFSFALEGMTTIAIVLYLLVAGLEVNLSSVTRQKAASVKVGLVGMLPPFALTFCIAMLAPEFLGAEPDSDELVFALFMGTAMSISALPVIVKILMDLNLFRSDLGMMIVASAIIRDIAGWMVFALLLGLIGRDTGGPHIGVTIGVTIAFVGVMLTLGRWLIHKSLPWIQAHATWPGGVLGMALTGGLLCAAFTEWLGIHAIFGAFIFGVALGDSGHLRAHTRSTMEQFVGFIFAPIFFASIGLKVNFADNFDPWLTLAVVTVGTVTMVGGSYLCAKWAGYPKRESWAVGFALNARGVMEIILGVLALRYGLISERLFVAIVIMAIFTSATSGTFMQMFLRREKSIGFRSYISSRGFLPSLAATNRREAIVELSQAVGNGLPLKPSEIAEAVWEREQQMSTGLDQGIAVPHARIAGLKNPVVAIGVSQTGIDFDTNDGMPTHLVCMILTPLENHQAQLEILADIARTFQPHGMVERATRVRNHTEFLALINSEKVVMAANGHGH